MFGKILEKTALIQMEKNIVLGFKEKNKQNELMFVVDKDMFNLNTIDFSYDEKQELKIFTKKAKKCKHETTLEQIPMSCERTREVVYCPKCSLVKSVETKKSPNTNVLIEIRNIQALINKDQFEVESKQRQIASGISKIKANRQRIEELEKAL